MLTTVNYVTENFNNQIWDFEDSTGYVFEDYIYTIITNELKPYYRSNLRVVKTSRTRDDGIDIYIESPVPFSLMGVKFTLNGKDKVKIVIECKSTSHNKITLEKFAKNILENNELNLDYFILITNGTIVPSAFYTAITEFEKVSCNFHLFDQYFLLQYLQNSIHEIKGNIAFVPHKHLLQLQYQIRKGRIDGRNCFELYFDIKNYSDIPTNVKLNLISNRNWNIDEYFSEKLIPAHQGICLRFLVKRIYNDGIDDFKLHVIYNNQSQILHIKNPEVIPDFQPPLTGKQHKEIINDIYNELLCLSSSQFYYLYGEAGIGKTRIIDEIVKRIYDTDYIIKHILCNARSKISLKDSLYKELKIANTNNNSWIDLLNFLEKNKFSRYLVIIEDLHNSTDEFYKQLKELVVSIEKYPCAFILAGREDDTVYNDAFFSCAYWLKNNIRNFYIKRLIEDDCKLFIKSVIKDIPSLVLERLLQVSSGNPFYIVQFIEYLLEIDFATLLNRNTVGMTNINTFASHKYIPTQIDNLIQKRQERLLQLSEGQKYIIFLQILCLFGISAPKCILEDYWGDENEILLDLLFRKHYLAYDDNGEIKFDHETLFLFYNKKLESTRNLTYISQLIVEKYEVILNNLPNFQKAKVLFYAKKYSDAEKIFSPILNDIENIKNISSTNLSREYFEYLDEVYQLAKRRKNHLLQEKIIQASVYIPMHNMDYGTTIVAINKALLRIDKNHSDNDKLRKTILQLRAHTELTAAKLKQAEQFFLELLAEERIAPDTFSPESRFDLFDRTASLYTRYNHKILAEKYNILSEKIANELGDSKLICLSLMMKAKIHYYSDPQLAVKYMERACKIMTSDNAYRINCHNNVSLIGANVMILSKQGYFFSKYIRDVKKLLTEAIDNNYSFTIIRCNLLLAALYYLSEDEFNINLSKQYINDGINASIRYGCEKLMNYFYNLKAVISIREGYSAEITLKYFDTMLDFLIKQNLVFLGNLDFCYGNIISITNYAKFIYNYGDEQRLYNFLNKLSYYKSNQTCDFECSKRKDCYYSCKKNVDIFRKNIKRIEERKLILLDEKYQYPLFDFHTGYYIIIH